MVNPKITFEIMSLEENIEIIKWSFFLDSDDLNVHDLTIEYFKELSDIDINMDKEYVYKKIEEVVTNEYNNYKNFLKSSVEKYNNIWSNHNDKYFLELSKYLKIEWPCNMIKAKVGLIPVFPRDINDYSFCISENLDDIQLVEVCAHESLHFLWFKKWEELFPEVSKDEYEPPKIIWKYSEMVTDPILNNKPFNEFLIFKERGYDSFYELYDGKELVMDKLRKIYSTNDDIDKKIINGFNYINNYFNN